MFGFYANFPENFHRADSFTYSLSRSSLQQKLIQVLNEMNRLSFTFEEVGSPAVPNSSVIFEFGIADAGNFNFLNESETKKVLAAVVGRGALQVMDLFCAIRYYKNQEGKKTPLRFDYFMLRMVFGKEKSLELQVFHERGPRYISPEELVSFLVRKVNGSATRKILKPVESV
jgi:hypothetical protein